MHRKRLWQWKFFYVNIAASSAGILICLILIFILSCTPVVQASITELAPQRDSVSLSAQNVASPMQTYSGIPIRLKIQKIGVNAKIESVGLTSQGAVGVPKGPTNAAWFNLSARTGNKGSAIITGHYGRWKNGLPTVFNRLDQLQKGDQLTIEDKDGNITAFVVRELRTFDANANALDVFTVNDGKEHVNLITCEGVWNKSSKSYPNRLVVYADKK